MQDEERGANRSAAFTPATVDGDGPMVDLGGVRLSAVLDDGVVHIYVERADADSPRPCGERVRVRVSVSDLRLYDGELT